MDIEQINTIGERFRNKSITVYGDFALDVYWFMDPDGSEISVETGMKGEAVSKQNYYLGGAANIISNLASLETGKITAVGIIGQDIFGKEILRQMNALGVNTDYMIVNRNFHTPVFIKRILKGREQRRIDLGFFNKRSTKIQKELISRIEQALDRSDALIFNQQIPDTIQDEYFITECNRLFKVNDEKIILVDSRHLGGVFRGVYLKMNDRESLVITGNKKGTSDLPGSAYIDIDTLKRVAKRIYAWNRKPMFVTRGSMGIMVYDGKAFHVIPGIEVFEETDTVGAGDTISSSLALCLSAGASIQNAAEFANIAATVTIRKLFTTGNVTIKEVRDTAKKLNYIYNQELAEDARKAEYLSNSEIEVCDPEIKLPLKGIKYVIFDNDGTISTLREGWEGVMEKVMIRSILGSSYKKVDSSLFGRVRETVAQYINNSTGIQTILQMEALIELVKRFNVVSNRKILDKFGYKKAYLEEFMKIVEGRIGKIKAGQLDAGDFLIAGSMEFIKKLSSLNLLLYLTSGTDFEYVLNECSILGYRKYFEGNIYGALDDVEKFSKKKLIKRIINENGLKGEELLVIGDGPVEIREGRRAGAFTIGIASDEKKRFGLNPGKRDRLIKAGAHFIIPDFSQKDKLFGNVLADNENF